MEFPFCPIIHIEAEAEFAMTIMIEFEFLKTHDLIFIGACGRVAGDFIDNGERYNTTIWS